MSKQLLHFLYIITFIPLCLYGEITYSVQHSGIEDSALLKELAAISRLERLANRPAQSSTALQRRADADKEAFIKLLHEKGHYDAALEMKIEPEGGLSVIKFYFTLGELYTLRKVNIIPSSQSDQSVLGQFSLEDLQLTLGKAATSKEIAEAEALLLKLLAERGFPGATVVTQELVAHRESKTLDLTITLDTGKRSYFGVTTIIGLDSVEESFVRSKIAWKRGEEFDRKKIDATQEVLKESGLFKSVVISTNRTDAAGQLSIEIALVEGKMRTIAAGVGYTSMQGPSITAEWEHRNLRGRGERVSARVDLSQEKQEAIISYLLPDFAAKDQNLIWQGELHHEKTKGYNDISVGVSAILDRKIDSRLQVSYGLAFKSIVTSQSNNNSTSYLLKAPVHLRWSSTDSALNPTEGVSINGKIAPSLQLAGSQFIYCPTTLTTTYYRSLNQQKSIIFAAKITAGTILGASRYAIPPSERFYAGDQATLRGYRYRSVSPLSPDNKPLGGKSIAVGSFELRAKLTKKFEGVAFYEIGNVYSDPLPKIGSGQLQSAGFGLRYHTPVGPIRGDIAFPIDRRKGIDPPYQIYMSIGQSF